MKTSHALPTPLWRHHALPFSQFYALSLLTMLIAGCGGPSYEVAQVDGVLKLKGKPGDKVMIQFIPDVQPGVNVPSSGAETDSEGRFTLHLLLRGGEQEPGAVVGSHRVVLTDLRLAASETGRGVEVRFDPNYAMVGSTTLTQEVAPGEQTIELSTP